MRLEALTVEPLSVRTTDPFVIATGQVQATRSILVRATLASGAARATGFGEGACLPPVTREDQPEALAAVQRTTLVGSQWSGLAALTTALDAQLVRTPVARAGVEVAILDAWAQLEGKPLWRWLGGTGPSPTLVTDITLPILAPKRMVTLALEWSRLGFTAFKVKVGKALEADLSVLAALVQAVPGASFRPDANGGLTVDEAVRYAEAARKLGATLECFEQPCRTVAELREVAAALEVPVLADESVKTLAELEALGAVDGVNLKLAKSGGLLAALELGRAARARKMPLMVGGMVETRLGMTAAAHLAAALGGVEFCDLDTAWLLAEDPIDGGYQASGPRYTLPSAPGLGVRLRA